MGLDVKVKCCPECGQPLLNNEVIVKLTKGEQDILNIVTRAGSHGVTSERLFDSLYKDDADGGPLTGHKTLHTRIYHLNQKIKQNGIVVRAGNGNDLYTVQLVQRRPNRLGQRVLTPRQVQTIRADYATKKYKQNQLAKKYHVSQGHISTIVNHK